MTLPSANRRGADRHCRWSRTGDDGGLSRCDALRRRSSVTSHDNRTCQGNPQPQPHPIGNPACSARRCPPQSSDQPATPKSP